MECLGLALYLAAHVPLAVVYALGSSLREVQPVPYWAAIGAGYLLVVGLAFARPARLWAVRWRMAFDAWLVTAAVALAVAAALVQARWPLAFDGWNGHGFGASGGEVNAVLFPWMHAFLWVGALAYLASPRPDPAQPRDARP
jgi:hypothetical protein